MLTDEVVAAFGEKMKTVRLIAAFALFAAAAACATERTVSPVSPSRSVASSVIPGNSQVPLLYVVDGKRLQRDEIPVLSPDQVSAVKVLKGHAALERYGQDASYGVVIITTKQALTPNT
jgi:outer membrane receptor protein involved in Fe transport